MTSRRSRWGLGCALLATTLLATGCGGRYTDAERLAAEGRTVPVAAEVSVAPTAAVPVRTGVVAARPAPAVAVPAKVGAQAVARRGAAKSPTTTTGPARPAATGRPAPGPLPARAPIKLASIGVRSGVLGAVFAPYYDGVIAWVNDVNRRGGLAGHPVELIPVDDGGDPRRAVAAAKRLVEEDKVLAFFGEHEADTFDAIIPYLEKKGMPVIGTAVPNVAHENTPIFFNTAYSSRTGLMWSHLLPIRLFHPEVKDIGVLYCGESEICKALNEEATRIAPQFGYRIVSRSQVSVAQPDYTAEVLAARSAGAKAIVLFIDNYSAIRIATSAHRQGYFPYFGIQGSAASEKFLRDGGKDVEGFLIGGSALHWTSPLMADFVAAYRAYVPDGIGLSSFAASSWNSGKLLEKIAPTWPANPTSADVIASLLALKGETLGGLIPPVTFHPGQKAGNQCATILRVENGQFVPYQGRNEYHCAPGYRPG